MKLGLLRMSLDFRLRELPWDHTNGTRLDALRKGLLEGSRVSSSTLSKCSQYLTVAKPAALTGTLQIRFVLFVDSNSNNHQDNAYGAVIVTHVIAIVHPVHLTNVGQHQVTQAFRRGELIWTACPPVGCYDLHPPKPFIITQPKSWYSFYRSTEGRRLSHADVLV